MKAGLWCVLHDSESEAVEILKTGCSVWETSVENYVYVPKMCIVQLLQSFAVILFFIFVLLFMHITGIV